MFDLLFEKNATSKFGNDRFEEQDEVMKHLSSINDCDQFRDITETEKTVHVG
jgi:hypothetical protein